MVFFNLQRIKRFYFFVMLDILFTSRIHKLEISYNMKIIKLKKKKLHTLLSLNTVKKINTKKNQFIPFGFEFKY